MDEEFFEYLVATGQVDSFFGLREDYSKEEEEEDYQKQFTKTNDNYSFSDNN